MRPVSAAGKVVAISGAARGIGFATAGHLHDLGAKVAIGDVDEAAVQAAGSRLGLPVYRTVDVTDSSSFTAFLDDVEHRLGPVDVLVNNAGVIAVGNAIDEADGITRRLLEVNVYGVILGTKLAARRMLPRGRGHVINIASLSSVTPTVGIATYSATKHAVLGYTDAVRLENRASGVHFSAVLPTLTNTEMIAGVNQPKAFNNAEPEDVARAVARLIAKPKPRVIVPRVVGTVTVAQRLLPQRVFERLERVVGAERIFGADVDAAQRRGYAKRSGTS